MEKRFNVYIYEYSTNRPSALIGSDMNESHADKREMTGLMRCNDDFGTKAVEVGCDEDVEFKKILQIT